MIVKADRRNNLTNSFIPAPTSKLRLFVIFVLCMLLKSFYIATYVLKIKVFICIKNIQVKFYGYYINLKKLFNSYVAIKISYNEIFLNLKLFYYY